MTDTADYAFFYTDNFFATYIQKMCLDNFVPTLEEITNAFLLRQFPSRFGPNTAEERELMAVPQGKDPKINAAGYKLAHIIPVGKEYLYQNREVGNSVIFQQYFPKGRRGDWKKTQDQTGSYHIIYLETLPESKKIAIAHFLRFVHPFNYFLCPKKDCELNNKCKELAEYPPLLHYVHDYMLETFGDAYHEFLALIMVSQEYFQSMFDLMYDKIQISYGINCSAFSKKQTIEGESNMKITEIRKDLQTLDLKELIIKHYLGQYRLQEIQEALVPFDINVIFHEGKKGPFPQIAGIDPRKDDGMDKNKAIKLFRQQGYQFCESITFSSKSGPDKYWANPELCFLQADWDLILNDYINKKLYLFRISANSLALSQEETRKDRPNRIDLQIYYNDPEFTDSRSKISFKPFFIKELDYSKYKI